MRTEFLTYTRETRRSTLFFAGLILLAWALLAAWQRSAYAGLLGHAALEGQTISFSGHLAAFLLSWLLMTLAMMLPGSLPMLLHTIEPPRLRPLDRRRASLVLAGYLLPWLAFGLFAYLGDSQLHHLAEPPGPLARYSVLIPPAILLVAGLYQLSPAKRHSLALCRPDSHAGFLPSSWLHLVCSTAFAQGLRLGGICVASCASLMLLMFALGHHRLDIMLGLSAILLAERLTAWGECLAWVIGAALLAASLVWLLAA